MSWLAGRLGWGGASVGSLAMVALGCGDDGGRATGPSATTTDATPSTGEEMSTSTGAAEGSDSDPGPLTPDVDPDDPSLAAWPVFQDRGVVFEHVYDLAEGPVISAASDPTVTVSDQGWEMTFTCVRYDVDPPATLLCAAISDDRGQTWTLVEEVEGAPVPGQRLAGIPGSSRARLEGSCSSLAADQHGLFFSAYADEPDPQLGQLGYPADLYLSWREAGGFTLPSEPVLARTPGGPDHDAVYSPTIIRDDARSRYFMVYAGHCFGIGCEPVLGGVRLLTATAPALEGPWTKGDPITFDDTPPWAEPFVAEPSLVFHEGTYFLFVTGFDATEQPRSIGGARALDLEDIWELRPEPLLRAEEVGVDAIVAPTVEVDDAGPFMLYTVIGEDGIQRIALATEP